MYGNLKKTTALTVFLLCAFTVIRAGEVTRLDEVLGKGLDQNPQTLAAAYSVEAAAARPDQAEALPDPRLTVGVMSVPVDTFELDQEPMTQITVGVAQTFPFQVALVGVVTSRFHKLLLVTLSYFVLTIFASGLRVMNLRDNADNADANEQLSHPFFVTMSSLAKLLAPFYYSMTIRAAYELCFPVYYDEEAWQKILEMPLLAERVRSARMAKEATRSARSRSRGHQYLDDQKDDGSSSVGSGSSSSVDIGAEK